MAKISPVSIKYMIHASFSAEGHLEKPDVIGAIFGQTEGLLGADLEMRELQKEGKIGRIEVDLERNDKRVVGVIKIPTALDQSETTLVAAAIETIERIGPSDAQIEVEKIEDVRGSKRDYIIERAKKLMQGIEGATDSRIISNEIKDSTKMSEVKEYGNEKLPCGDLSEKEIIIVEGRADVLNLIKNRVKNVVAMNGTKLPEDIRKLSKEKEIILFVDGDRGGKLIAQNVTNNAEVNYIAVAPDGKEVEELTGKEILMSLRKKVPVSEFFSRFSQNRFGSSESQIKENPRTQIHDISEEKLNNQTDKKQSASEKEDISDAWLDESKLKEISKQNSGSGKAILLNNSLKKIKETSVKSLQGILKRTEETPTVIIIDGSVTNAIIKSAEELQVKIIVAKNFTTTDTNIKLLSL